MPVPFAAGAWGAVLPRLAFTNVALAIASWNTKTESAEITFFPKVSNIPELRK